MSDDFYKPVSPKPGKTIRVTFQDAGRGKPRKMNPQDDDFEVALQQAHAAGVREGIQTAIDLVTGIKEAETQAILTMNHGSLGIIGTCADIIDQLRQKAEGA